MSQHEKLNYVEFGSTDLSATKAFFNVVFGWTFTDYGDQYIAFENQGLDGGFYQSDKVSTVINGGALLVFYSDSLATTYDKVVHNGGTIVKNIFQFPGGYRFHFTEPSGNEFSVWSKTNS